MQVMVHDIMAVFIQFVSISGCERGRIISIFDIYIIAGIILARFLRYCGFGSRCSFWFRFHRFLLKSLYRPVKIGDIVFILLLAEYFKLVFSLSRGLFGAHASGVCQKFPFAQFQEVVQLGYPVRHFH